MEKEKHAGGRPLAYSDPKKLQADVDKYFKEEPQPTLAGLAYALGIDRQTLYNYEDKEQYFDIIKRARDKVASTYETRLIYGSQPTGVIFALKNMGWKDKTESEINGNLSSDNILIADAIDRLAKAKENQKL